MEGRRILEYSTLLIDASQEPDSRNFTCKVELYSTHPFICSRRHYLTTVFQALNSIELSKDVLIDELTRRDVTATLTLRKPHYETFPRKRETEGIKGTTLKHTSLTIYIQFSPNYCIASTYVVIQSERFSVHSRHGVSEKIRLKEGMRGNELVFIFRV